jgi:tRNA G18 (ribose-2'-O)-methylase SpoU
MAAFLVFAVNQLVYVRFSHITTFQKRLAIVFQQKIQVNDVKERKLTDLQQKQEKQPFWIFSHLEKRPYIGSL